MYYSARTGGFYDVGIHHIPTDAVEITTERHAELMQAQSEGKVITADADGSPIAVDPPPISRAQALADKRYQVEVGGVVWNDWPVATDRDSQAKINAAYVMARDGHWPAGAGWKFGDGVYRPLTADQVQELALAVAAHVQACFAIEAAKLADPSADIEVGWPA